MSVVAVAVLWLLFLCCSCSCRYSVGTLFAFIVIGSSDDVVVAGVYGAVDVAFDVFDAVDVVISVIADSFDYPHCCFHFAPSVATVAVVIVALLNSVTQQSGLLALSKFNALLLLLQIML